MITLTTVGTGSKGNAYILRDGNWQFLLDAGVPWKSIQKACEYQPLDGAVCSHWHGDHVDGAKQVSRYGCDIYAGEDAAQGIAERTGARIRPLKPQKAYRINGWNVLCFPLPHEDVPNYGFVIRSPMSYHKLAYLTDFGYTKYRFKQLHVDSLLISCNHMDNPEAFAGSENFGHVVRGHSSLSVVKEIVTVNQTDSLKHIVLCHISEENGDPDEMARQIAEIAPQATVHIAEKSKLIILQKEGVDN